MNAFLQEWAEACIYAKECLLPPSIYGFWNREPWTAIFFIFSVCLAMWLVTSIRRGNGR